MNNLEKFSKIKTNPRYAYSPYEYAKMIYESTKGEYEVLSDFKGQHNFVWMKHCTCGYEYQVKPNNFKYGKRCPKCAGNQKWTTDDLQEWLDRHYPNEYEVLEEYINNDTPILIRHKECEYKWSVRPRSVIHQKYTCPQCSHRKKLSTEEFKEYIKNNTELNEYTLLEEYINNNTPILIKHNKCGHEYKVSPSNFKSGRRCPKCSTTQSRGAKQVENFLKEHHIDYSTEIIVNIDGHNLRFDFFIPSKNLFIEYDGEQHFNASSWGGTEGLEIRQKYDSLKNSYCAQSSTPNLLRISYLQQTEINNILQEKLEI